MPPYALLSDRYTSGKSGWFKAFCLNRSESAAVSGTASPIKAGGGKVDEDLVINYFKTAYHKMCIGCHREMKAENQRLEKSGRVLKSKLPNVGPTSCNGCHVKEE